MRTRSAYALRVARQPVCSSTSEPSMDVDLVLSRVLEFAGKNEWLFVGGVCRRWQQLYHHVAPINRTSYTAAMQSPTRLQLAIDSGIKLWSCRRTYAHCRAAAMVGSKSVLLLAKANGMPWDTVLSGFVGEAGRLDILNWLCVDARCPVCVEDVAVSAASAGNILVLEWCMNIEGWSWDVERVTTAAVRQGHVAVLQWLLEHDRFWDEDDLMTEAAFSNQKQVIIWLRQKGFAMIAELTMAAAWRGHLTLLKWLIEEGCPVDPDIVDRAAESNSVQVIQWLYEHQHGVWTADTLTQGMVSAALCGCLQAAQWFRAAGAAWPESFVEGYTVWKLPVLKWALKEGCPWGDWLSEDCATLEFYPDNGQDYYEELHWAHNNGCPCSCARPWQAELSDTD